MVDEKMLEGIFVSIVIPTYNNACSLRKAVESLCVQTYPKNNYEIIVVDDGSTDNTAQCIEELKNNYPLNLQYFSQDNKGPSAARNLGIKHARGDIVAFIDSDCIAADNWIEEIIRFYDNDKVAGVGGKIEAVPTALTASRYCAYIRMHEKPKIDKTGVAYLITGNASFIKSALKRAGGFDERYNFPGGEELDLCYRLKRCKYSFRFNSKAIVYNSHKQGLKALLKSYFNYGKGDSFLILRKLSKWEMSVKVTLLLMKNVTFIIRFFKIPFKAMLYYGEGMGFQGSLAYAFFDYAKQFAFAQGSFVGYIIGKIKGFKKNDCERDFL